MRWKPRWRSIRKNRAAFTVMARVAIKQKLLRPGDPPDQQGAVARADRSRCARGPGRGDGRAGRRCRGPRRISPSCRSFAATAGCPQVALLSTAIAKGPALAAAKAPDSSEEELGQRARERDEFLDADRFGAPFADRFRALPARRARPASPSGSIAASCAAGRMLRRSAAPGSLGSTPAGACGRHDVDHRRGDLGRRHEGRAMHRHRDARGSSATARRPTAGRNARCPAWRRSARPLRAGTSRSATTTTAATARPASAAATQFRHCRAGWRRYARRRRPRRARRSRSASPRMIRSRPGNSASSSASAGMQRRSRSTATTLAPVSSNARVRPPGPGPTS